MRVSVPEAVEVARKAVEAGGRAALAHFRTDALEIEWKPDESPVTRADKEAEAAIVRVILERFPEHGILGEEGGARAGAPGIRWIIDPIDGTRGFARGGGFWGPLVACEVDGEIVASAAALPVQDATFWAGKHLGAFRDGTRLHVSSIERLDEATLSVGELKRLLRHPRASAFHGLLTSVASVRSYGDLAGCVQVLEGRAEAWIETGVQVWDLAPLSLLVTEAGGRFTDLHGRPGFSSGEAIASNGRVHDLLVGRILGES